MSDPGSSGLAGPVRILSDLHLAHPASVIERLESLRPLLEGAGTVVFNGDTCELASAGWQERGLELLEGVKELCRKAGARPVFLPGNHDPRIAEEGWLELAGGKILVLHGHAIFDSVAPWSHEYLKRKKRVWEIVRERDRPDADLAHRWETTQIVTEAMKPKRARELGKKGGGYLVSAVWPPERSFNILRVWLTMVGEAGRFLERYRPEARVLLFGHFHRPGTWERGGRHLWNSGAFMRGSRPLVAEWNEGELSLKEANREGTDYRFGETRALLRIETS